MKEKELTPELLLAGLRSSDPRLRKKYWTFFVTDIIKSTQTDTHLPLLSLSAIPFHKKNSDDNDLYSRREMYDAFCLALMQNVKLPAESSLLFFDRLAVEKEKEYAIQILLRFFHKFPPLLQDVAIEKLEKMLTKNNHGYSLEILESSRESKCHKAYNLALEQMPLSLKNHSLIIHSLSCLSNTSENADILLPIFSLILNTPDIAFDINEIIDMNFFIRSYLFRHSLQESQDVIKMLINSLFSHNCVEGLIYLLGTNNSVFHTKTLVPTVISELQKQEHSAELDAAILDYLMDKHLRFSSDLLLQLSQNSDGAFREQICTKLIKTLQSKNDASEIEEGISVLFKIVSSNSLECLLEIFKFGYSLFVKNDKESKIGGRKLLSSVFFSSRNISKLLTSTSSDDEIRTRGQIWEVLDMINVELSSFPSHLMVKFLHGSVYYACSKSDISNINNLTLEIAQKAGKDGFNFSSQEMEMLGDILCRAYHNQQLEEESLDKPNIRKMIESSEERYQEHELLNHLL